MIKQRLNVDVQKKPGKHGEFEVFADGVSLAKRGGNFITRSFGAGYPAPEAVVERLERKAEEAASAL
jgi:hypothetical protein